MDDDVYARNHVTYKTAEKRQLKLQYLTVQHDRHKPAHERLNDPRYATGVYRKRFEDFGPDRNFRRAMERRISSRQREMKVQFPLELRQTREDLPRHARRPPKQYDSYLREQFNASASDASSFLRQASHPDDDEQALSPLSNTGGRRGTYLPGIRGAGGDQKQKQGKQHHRRHKSRAETSHHIHGHYEVTLPKDFDQRKKKLLATLARFKKAPRGGGGGGRGGGGGGGGGGRASRRRQ